MHNLIPPVGLVTTTIGEENSESECEMTPALSISSNSASIFSWTWGLAL